MLKFKKIILHNFGSYGHAEVELENKGICLVSGKNNYKKDNALSNGSGKSFLWSGICFALTGETISGLKSNLKNIFTDENLSYVTLDFDDNTDNYVITRYIAPKSDLKIIKNDVDISGKGIRESEKKLGEVLPDINKDLIASTIIIGQGMPNKFSSFSPSGRKDLLEKLTKSDFMVEDIRQRVNTRLTELQRQLRDCEDSVLIHKTKNKTVEDTLRVKEEELSKAVKPDFISQINGLTTQVELIQKDISLKTEQFKTCEEKETKANDELVKILEENTAELSFEKEAYDNAYRSCLTEKTKIESEIRSLKQEINRLKSIKDTCPTCGQKLPGAVKPDTSIQEQEVIKLNESLTVETNKLNEYNRKHTEYQAQIKAKYEKTITDLKAQIATTKQEKDSANRDIINLTSQQNTLKEQLTKLNYDKDNWDKYYERLQKEIEGLQETVAKNSSRLLLLESTKADLNDHLAVIKKMETLIKRDFRGYLLENIIKYVDQVAKDYSDIVFGTRELNVYLDGNALDISYCGKMFDNLSGGEKQRVDLILQFAIRKMLTAYLNTSSNMLVLDEITDFLDKQSCKAIMKLIEKELATIESVFVVSHHAAELELPVDSELKINKTEDGISEII